MNDIITTGEEHLTLESLLEEVKTRGYGVGYLRDSDSKTVGYLMGSGKGIGFLHDAGDASVDPKPGTLPKGTLVRVSVKEKVR